MCSSSSVNDSQESVAMPKNKRIMAPDNGDNRWPPWLKPLLKERFFGQCQFHANLSKSKCNMFCLDCINGALCSLCLPHHNDHHIIQVRRSTYQDVIRVNEIPKVLDIAGVQTQILHSAKVVFLNQRPPSRLSNGVTYPCQVCRRSLTSTCSFCSLGCMIAGTSEGVRENQKNRLRAVAMESDDSCSSSARGGGRQQRTEAPSFDPPAPLPTAVTSRTQRRRKGIPHRAPLY